MDKLQAALKGVRGRTVAVLGLAFKPGTDDVRDAPALDVVRLARGARQVLDGFEVEWARDPYEAAQGADGIVLATEWPEYGQLDLGRLAGAMHNPVLVDGRNLFDPERAREAGFTDVGVGR